MNRHSPLSFPQAQNGGKETRTPDILLAKQALYQLSYAPLMIGSWKDKS